MTVNECPVCGLSIPVTSLERHVNSHLDEAETARDHALALELALVSCPSSLQVQTAELKNCLDSGEEDQYGKEDALLKRIKTTDSSSTLGNSSRNDCGRDIQSLISTQRRGKYTYVEEGILKLIKDCLCSERQDVSRTVISAQIDHFETSRSEDIGWGCGWRNIQMLSSHLLMYQWAREALFGGVGFVPDICSLQKWLELAWARGFDELGAKSFRFQIDGSKEWIGTAECATLLRSFGLRARIVDFSSDENLKNKSQVTIDRWFPQVFAKPENTKRKTFDELPTNTEIHYNVECDGCGVCPIQGVRYRSKTKANYDLCSSCIVAIVKVDDYEEIPSIEVDSAKQELAKDEDVNHESLVKWVWNYFTVGIKDAASKACLNSFQGHIAQSDRSPLYFQHQGHSRTIVGIQRRKKNASSKEEMFLLVLDPSIRTGELLHALRSRQNWQKMIKRGVHTLKKRSYQVCYVEPGVAKGEELEQLKTLGCERF